MRLHDAMLETHEWQAPVMPAECARWTTSYGVVVEVTRDTARRCLVWGATPSAGLFASVDCDNTAHAITTAARVVAHALLLRMLATGHITVVEHGLLRVRA